MEKFLRVFILTAIATCVHATEMPKSDPFVPFAEIPAEELMPSNACFGIAKDGSLLLGGKPRYFPAVL